MNLWLSSLFLLAKSHAAEGEWRLRKAKTGVGDELVREKRRLVLHRGAAAMLRVWSKVD